MNRRFFLFSPVVLIASHLLVTSPAFAKDGEDDGNDDEEDDDGEDDSDDGEDDGEDDGGDDHGGDDNGKPDISGGRDSANAKQRVDSQQALPLDQVMKKFRALGNYTLVDVRLSSTSSERLVYVFKYIDTSGKVTKCYFDALTGTLLK